MAAQLTWSPPGRGLPQASADEPTALVRITLTSMTPSVVRPGDTVQIAGTVTNVSGQPLTGLSAYFWRSTFPLTSAGQVTAAAASESNDPIGSRRFGFGEYDPLFTDAAPSLADQASVAFTLKATTSELIGANPANGVYLMGVQVLAQTSNTAIGRARLFVPVVNPQLSSAATNSVQLTSLVALTSTPSQLRSGVLSDDHLANEVAPGGRLDELLSDADQPGTSYAVDPNLIVELRTMTAGYQVVGSDGELVSGTGRTAAETWLRRFTALQAEHDGYRLPYADYDLAALVRDGRLEVARNAETAAAKVSGVGTLPLLIAPPDGAADQSVLDAAHSLSARAVLLSADSVGGLGPLLRQPDGVTILSYDTGATAAGPGPAPDDTPVQLRGSALAGTYVQALSSEEGSTSGRLRLITSPDQAGGGLDPSEAPWLKLGDVAALLSRTPTSWSGQPDYPAAAKRHRLSSAQVERTDELGEDFDTYAQLLADPGTVGLQRDQSLARAVSVAWRSRSEAQRSFVQAQTDVFDSILHGTMIKLEGQNLVLTGSAGNVPLTVVNDFDQRIRVQITFTSPNRQRLSVSDVPAGQIGVVDPNGHTPITAAVQARANGALPITCQLTTVDGRPVGQPLVIEINPTRAGRIGWLISLGALVVLVAATAFRIRQVRRERAGTEPAPTSAPGPTVAETRADLQEGAELQDEAEERSAGARLISATAVMAAGTMASRVLGFVRIALLIFVLGNGTPQVDTFNIANGIPNMLYILLAGGVLNTVFVPQIVRAMKNDPDGGEAYTNRLVTVGLLALVVITTAVTLLAPAIMWLYTDGRWKLPGNAAHFDNIVLLAYLCLPQIFFYGVNVLIGQVLNSRGRFAPMAWSPLANNVIAVIVLVVYLGIWHTTADPDAPFSTGQILLLGLGSTAGIVVQAAVLIPFMARSGFRFRPRFDFANAGLGRTAHLAKWTLGYVVATQIAVWIVTRLASGATLGGPNRPPGDGAGLTVYNNAYLLWILPHSLITVSLATALLPSASRRAAAGDLSGAGAESMRAMRLATTAIVPATVAFLALAFPISRLLFGNGRGADDWQTTAWTLTAFAVGLIPFTIQYLCLRGFYALEDTRTPFFIQLVIAGTNSVLALLLVLPVGRPQWVAVGLALAYALSYVVGLGVSFRLLRRRLPALNGPALARHCVRLAVAVIPGGLLAAGVSWLFSLWSQAFVVRVLGLAVGGLIALALFVALASLLRIAEVSQLTATVGARLLPGRFRGEGSPADRVDPELTGDSSGPGPLDSGTIVADDPSVADDAITGSVAAIESLATAESSIVTHVGASGAGQIMATTTSQTPLGPPAADAAPEHAADTPEGHLPPGTILGRRYRLEELLVSAQPAVTWRAFDQVLSRSVLVHLLPVGDPRAPRLLDAARRAAIATDSRFLRVLDAVDPSAAAGRLPDEPDVGSYIVCEYTTGQSLQTILNAAPLTGLEAGWVLREVADALGGMHTLGLHHRRINPDTVIITPAGNIKIVGLLIEAALHPGPSEAQHGPDAPTVAIPAGSLTGSSDAGEDPDAGGEAADVHDLGRLLYAMLVSRWPGGSAFGLPAAPQGRDGQLGSEPGHHLDGHYVDGHHLDGDPAGQSDHPEQDQRPQLGPEQQRWLTPRQVRHGVSPALDRICDQLLSAEPRHRVPPITSTGQLVMELNRILGPGDAAADLERRLRHPGGVHAALAGTAPGGIGTPRSAFLGHSTQNVSARSPRSPGRVRAAADGVSRVSSPVEAEVSPLAPAWTSRPDQPRHHPQRWIGLVIALALVVVLTIAVVAVLRRPQNGQADAPANPSAGTATTASSPAATGPLTIASVDDFDPTAQGGNGTENPSQAKYAIDGDPKTRWTTLTYRGSAKLGNLKQGVGLVLDLGRSVEVSRVDVDLSGSGTDVELRVPTGSSTPPVMRTDKAWRRVAEASAASGQTTLQPTSSVRTRYLLVYLTSLPKEGSGYRGGIDEVEVEQ